MSTDTASDLDLIRAEALRGPWIAVIADEYGFVVDENLLDDGAGVDPDGYDPDDLTVQIVRGTAAPGTRPDGDDERLPGTYQSGDHLVQWDGFEELDEVRARWEQAQAMVAGLNAAAEGGAR